jgi:hypothetical protein
MKKILIILGLFLSAVTFGQIKVDTLDYTTTPLSGEYTILFGDYPAKYMKRVRMQYLQPMVYDLTAIRPRLITDNLMLGTSTNYNYKLYVNGLSYFNNTTYNATGVRHYFGSCWIGDVAGDINFYSPTAGTKSLADLATGGSGSVDVSGLTNGSMLYKWGDTISGNTNFTYKYGTLKLITPANDTGMYLWNNSSLDGLSVNNSSSGRGIYAYNSSTGYATSFYNSSTGYAEYITNTSTGTGLHIHNQGTGSALKIYNVSTGVAIRVYNSTDTAFTVTNDAVYFNYLAAPTDGSRFLVMKATGEIDTGTLSNNASEQLVMHLSPIKEYVKDQRDGELAGYYTKNGQLIKNYGLKDNETGQSLGLETIEILMGHAERAYRYIYRRVLVDNIQWCLIGLLLLWVIRLEIKIRRK